jgi:hypothetical protein
MTEAEVLLADVQALRRKARRDRRASAFPLFLFGGLILLAPLCYVPDDPLPPEILEQGYSYYPGPFPMFSGIFARFKYPDLVGWYWLLTIVGGFAATAWWYRRRAMRVGVETDATGYLVAVGAALTGFLLGMPLLDTVAAEISVDRMGLYSKPGVNLPILIGTAVGSAVVLFWATRSTRGRTPRAAGLVVGVLLATVAFSSVGVYMFIRGYAALLVIGAGLLALAWIERNVLLGVVGLVFSGAALLVNLYDMTNVYYRLGGSLLPLPPTQQQTLVELLLPAVVLIVGGVLAALSGRIIR